VIALNPGQPVLDWPRNAPHKYSKSTYSTRFGFNVPAGPATLAEGGLDNGISISEDNRFFRVREHCLDPEVREGVAYSRWQPWPDVEIRTWLVAAETCHLRIHRITTQRKLWIIEGGFPAAYTQGSTLQMQAESPTGPTVRTPQGASALRSLLGQQKGETAELGANSSLVASLTAMPVLRSVHDTGEHWVASAVGSSADSRHEFQELSEFIVESDKDSCRILRKSEPWWKSQASGCGESSPMRLTSLLQPV
jgi:hypothetical protein